MSQNRAAARTALFAEYQQHRDKLRSLLASHRRNVYMFGGVPSTVHVRDYLKVYRAHRRAYWRARDDARSHFRPAE